MNSANEVQIWRVKAGRPTIVYLTSIALYQLQLKRENTQTNQTTTPAKAKSKAAVERVIMSFHNRPWLNPKNQGR